MLRVFALTALACTLLSGAEPPGAFKSLPLGAVKPRGWLADQLHTQAAGLSGHLHEFWPDLGPTSGWLGGNGESWERGPYYTDGLVPLAYLANDERLIALARKFVEWTIANQRPDGAIGPAKNTDWWPNMVMLKALAQYAEVTGDARVVPLMQRYFRYHLANADVRPLKQWASYRWQDEVWSILWLYDRTHEPWLLELAHKLKIQGYDWQKEFADFPYRAKGAKGNTDLRTHIVNNTQALKTEAIWYRVTGNKADRDAIYRHFNELERYHMLPNGLIAGDEHLAGLDPSQGTELCAVVEGMFSLENVLAVTGDVQFADRLEKWAYNGLPGTFDARMWAHQYDQQPNQIRCDIYPRNWTTNRPDSNIYGLEPNFGCCTANFHQGWPKFVSHLWMTAPGDGLVAAVYGPSEVQTKVRGIPVSIVEETDYPFRGRIRFTVKPSKNIEFPLYFRIPGWAESVTISLNNHPVTSVKAGNYQQIVRTWRKGDWLELLLPMPVRASRWINGSIALERGPLVFSLAVGEDWRKLKQYTEPPLLAADWEVAPKSPWNYALIVDPANANRSVTVEDRGVGKYPWSSDDPPVVITAKATRVPAWTIVDGSAGPLPQSPVKIEGAVETVRLIPYGAAKLRITAMPVAR